MLIKINPEIEQALQKKLPVVALESTIISHGMPYPQSVEMAMECERIIRSEGAIPATIAVINGILTIGLTKAEIEILAKEGHSVHKTSRRDLPYVVQTKRNGALTVSGTMIAASLAGIRFFATGGIGGVHRGAEVTMDISADLEELAMTDVMVVCAGAKAILDLEKTLEYLETKGVPVLGYQTKKLPAFYTRESDYNVDFQMDTPGEIAEFYSVKHQLGLKGGVLVCNPIPESHSIEKAWMDKVINEALDDMIKLGIKGKDTTPYLLGRIVEKTKGVSLEANIALVYNNCRLAAQIALAYAQRS